MSYTDSQAKGMGIREMKSLSFIEKKAFFTKEIWKEEEEEEELGVVSTFNCFIFDVVLDIENLLSFLEGT